MMRRLRIPILILGTAGVAFTGLYAYARPNWRLLTERELRETLKPELQQTDPIDLDAQARYRQFKKIVAALSHDGDPYDKAVRKTERNIRKLEPEVRALEMLVFAGPMQNPKRGYDASPFEPMYPLRELAGRFVSVARSQAAAGDGPSATRNYLTAIGITEQVANLADDWSALSYQTNCYEALDGELFKSPLGLSESDLGQIARAIPASTLRDPDSRRVILLSCQTIYPALVDPIGWTRKIMPSQEDTERTLARFVADDLAGPDKGNVLTYDARETAEHFNHIVPLVLANTERTFRDQDKSAVRYGTRLTASYPAYGAAGKAGVEFWFKKMEYRWATAKVRNGLGDKVIQMVCEDFDVAAVQSSFFRRALRESIRTRIALHRYRLRYSRPAPDLASLVKTGLLAALPLDPYDGASLRYDPARHRLWSVGENGKDENGKATHTGDHQEPDIIWKTL